MAQWEGPELERRTAVRLFSAGFVPVLNVRHQATNSEFDVYAYHAHEDCVTSVLVACSTTLKANKLYQLDSQARVFDLDHKLFVSEPSPGEDQTELLKMMDGLAFVSEDPNCGCDTAEIDGCVIDVQCELSPREQLMMMSLRVQSHLHDRVRSKEARGNELAERIKWTWYNIECAGSISCPFKRLAELYDIHFRNPCLSADCALTEKLHPSDKFAALKKAYAENEGHYTQSALACQTLNRTLTLITLSECACRVNGGMPLPETFLNPDRESKEGRVIPLIKWMSEQPFLHKFGRFAFALLHGWGGMSISDYNDVWRQVLADDVGCEPVEIDTMIEFADHLIVRSGQQDGYFKKNIAYYDNVWSNVLLMPYYQKGIGVLRFAAEECDVDLSFWSQWSEDVIRLDREARTGSDASTEECLGS